MIDAIEKLRIANPFYANHIFSVKDLDRNPVSQWSYPILFFLPMKIQISDGYEWRYKTWRDRYYLLGYEKFNYMEDK